MRHIFLRRREGKTVVGHLKQLHFYCCSLLCYVTYIWLVLTCKLIDYYVYDVNDHITI